MISLHSFDVEKGAITADHPAAQCIHMITRKARALCSTTCRTQYRSRLAYTKQYQPDHMVSTYGILPAPDQVEAARSWIADF